MDAKRFDKLVSRLGRVITLIDADVQACAVFAVEQSILHRNSSPANALFQAVSKCKGALRVDCLAKFFEQHGHLAYMKSEKRIDFFDVEEVFGMPREFDEPTLMATPWRLAKDPVSIDSDWDVKDMLNKLIDKCEKALGKNDRKIANSGILVELKALVAKGNISTTEPDDSDVAKKLLDESLARLAA